MHARASIFRTSAALAAAAMLACAATVCAQRVASGQDAPSPGTPSTRVQSGATFLELATATPAEAEALNRMVLSQAWPLRALATMRLERYDCEPSATRLLAIANDASWRVRAYAFACLSRRGVRIDPVRLEAERDPRVVRTLLRCRQTLPTDAVERVLRPLEKSAKPAEALLALEIIAALDRAADPAIRARMDALLSRVVLRMDRTEAGMLSSRIAAITSGRDSGRDYRWREWHRKEKRNPGFRPALLIPESPEGTRVVAPNRIASLDSARFAALDAYLASIGDRPMDLAILIDCTASMSSTLAEAQATIDVLADFLGSVTAGVRVGIVGYRDRTDEWETKAWDFTASADEARTRLWSLSAMGGGDTPESVLAAMRVALTKFSWRPDAPPHLPQPIRACVLVGDAPPHAGDTTPCMTLARKAFARGVRCYGIITRDEEQNLKPEDAPDAPVKSPGGRTPAHEGGPIDANDDDATDDKMNDTRDTGDSGDTMPAIEPPPPVESPTRAPPTVPGRRVAPPIAPPRAPTPIVAKQMSFTRFPEIAEAGGGRAEILRDKDSLAAQIAELTIADKYRDEFADFFAAFRLLCR